MTQSTVSTPPAGLSALGSRVVVLGVSGSGKSTLAAELARRLGVPHVELDALHWGPNWTSSGPDLLRERVLATTSGEGWVVDGNYRAVSDVVWPRAQTIIWLDYSLPLILLRLFRRTLRRYAHGVELWNGNRERFWPQFYERDGLFMWAITSQPKHRREYPLIPTQPETAHVNFIHLRSPRATARWLSQLR